jgi:CheY-like chemotaxis protein
MKTILIVEDNEKHRCDAEAFFKNQDVTVIYATNFREARKYVPHNDYRPQQIDGAIIDLFLPQEDACKIDPNMPPAMYRDIASLAIADQPRGLGIGLLLEAQAIPYVYCTAGYHHGSAYEWINIICKDRNTPLVDGVDADYGSESETKDWAQAYEKLSQRMR